MGKYRKKSFTLIRQGVNQGNRVGTRDSSKQSKGIGAPGGIVIQMKMFVEPLKKVITPMTGKRLMKISNQT
jgi:hypothetical protein